MFKAKKSLGQNFLTNPRIAAKIAESANLESGEIVLEIGPGTGMLTRELLKAGARVVALEADHRAVEVLKNDFDEEIRGGTLDLIEGDARTTDLANLVPEGSDFKVVANIPYYLSGMLFQTLLSSPRQPRTLVFLVQKEVAERIARSKKESLLSLSIKAYGKPSYIGTVSRGNFSPSPNVDSAILQITSISREYFKNIDETCFFSVLKAGFASRRKQLLGNLGALTSREKITQIFAKLGIPEKVRGEDLHIDTWLQLSKELCPLFIRK